MQWDCHRYNVTKVPKGNAIQFVPGTSQSPYYCAPLVYVLNFSGRLEVWRFHKQTNKQKVRRLGSSPPKKERKRKKHFFLYKSHRKGTYKTAERARTGARLSIVSRLKMRKKCQWVLDLFGANNSPPDFPSFISNNHLLYFKHTSVALIWSWEI